MLYFSKQHILIYSFKAIECIFILRLFSIQLSEIWIPINVSKLLSRPFPQKAEVPSLQGSAFLLYFKL